ncbi:MAG: hypothetical protein QOI74_4164 [Micromonosporaceae bacterium]|jgi:cytochrome P450|nr:hypothetical protein [Micromonosporaceae bacterium]MDT5035413.1 hypothetical protein [Micromonosporaceae bacterium]
MTDVELAARPTFFVDGGHSLHRWLGEARAEKPVFFDEAAQAWRVLRYDDAVHVLSEWKVFSNDMLRAIPQQEMVEGNFGVMDPPLHRHYRDYLASSFTRGALADLRTGIAARITAAFDRAGTDGMDIVEQLAYPLPMDVIDDLFGIPDADRDIMRRYADGQLSLTSENPMADDIVKARDATTRELNDYLRHLFERRRGEPGADLISRLVTTEVDGQRLTEKELLTLVTVLLGAGHVTTMGLLSNVFVCLTENPELLGALRADRSLIAGAVEEVMRVRPPVPDSGRITNHEVTLRDQRLGANQMILISLLSANRDERQFPDPDRFDPTRSPNRQLAFSHGIHFCLGAHLARLEAQILLEIVAERFRAVTETATEWPEHFGLTAPRRLVVALEPA